MTMPERSLIADAILLIVAAVMCRRSWLHRQPLKIWRIALPVHTPVVLLVAGILLAAGDNLYAFG